MKIVDKLIGKVGTDKALHFLVGALVTSYASMVNEVCMWVAVGVVMAIAKEIYDKVSGRGCINPVYHALRDLVGLYVEEV